MSAEWIKAAKVGDRVVAVDMDRYEPKGYVLLEPVVAPETGKIYTIRSITIGVLGGVVCFKVHEIADQKVRVLINGEERIGDVVFDAVGFRPVQPRKTSISIFTDILKKASKPVEEHA